MKWLLLCLLTNGSACAPPCGGPPSFFAREHVAPVASGTPASAVDMDVVVEISRETGVEENTGKNGMTRCVREQVVHRRVTVRPKGGAPVVLVERADAPGTYVGRVHGYAKQLTYALDDGASYRQSRQALVQLQLEDTPAALIVRWTPHGEHVAAVTTVWKAGIASSIWQDRKYEVSYDPGTVAIPRAVLATPGSYRITVERDGLEVYSEYVVR
jgi:hypothetical protein